MRGSHREANNEEVKDGMVLMPELRNDVIDGSQIREKLPPELQLLDTDRLSQEDKAGGRDVATENKPRIARMIAELYASGYKKVRSTMGC